MGNVSARGFEPVSNNGSERGDGALSTANDTASQQGTQQEASVQGQGASSTASVTINVNPDPSAPQFLHNAHQQHGEESVPGTELQGEIHAPEPQAADREAAAGEEGEHHPLLPPSTHKQLDRPDAKEAGSSNSSSSSGSKTCSNNSPESGEGKKAEAEPPARICRICFDSEEEPDNPLIHPCLCQGSHGSVHRKCLQTWRDTQRASLHSQAYFRCEICHYEYQYVRLDSAACIAHPVVVATAFLLMLFAICTLLGVVPIIQACLEAYDIHFTGWLHVLVHLCDGLMVMGLVSVMMVACTSPQLARMQPARLGYNCSLIMCWCRMIGCGQVCGPVWLASLAVLAFLGLINSIPVAFMILYHVAKVLTGATVRMVENVDPNEVRAHKAKAAPPSTSSGQQQQQQQQQRQQGSSFQDAALAV
eukprot:CAMPEP_0202350074 /NCGR_PEP_ID=MMETSP1126-20121109/7292_1 /ASSEMBLY_ACC=CAM_ASM_000457 /TAXON_ID=3047 /ORGANISM="Dunaliella tertiolecta, Strain CCMP1320" /LENGTH=419 /DNA_ID=CAMNT_0048941973 /DNA_START=51 /DNA_END=1310 /DNA_ORIENTATION=+